MEKNSLVSIIIPCYNDAKYIEQAVASALNQTYPNIEVIVVDDGSNLETKAILQILEPKITKLITQENQGQSTARNRGIIEAKGEYVLVLDSDDYFEPTFCQKALTIFLERSDVKVVTCQAYLMHEDGSVKKYIPKGGNIKSFIYTNAALGSTMFKKNDWRSVNGYDENMRKGFEDWEFYIRILKNEGCVYVISERLFTYRKRSDSTTSIANKVKYELLFYIFTKHRDLYVEDFENFVRYLLGRIEIEERDKLKYFEKSDRLLIKSLSRITSFFNRGQV